MNAVHELQAIGYAVTVKDDKVRFSWKGQGQPDPKVVRPLLEDVRNHKPEAIRYLRGEQPFFSEVLNVEGICRDTPSGTKVEIDGLTYASSEVDRLRGLSPEKMRAVHLVKKTFDGEVIR